MITNHRGTETPRRQQEKNSFFWSSRCLCASVVHPSFMSLVTLFEDNHCLAVAKPAPLLTQGVPTGLPTLDAQVKDYLKAKYNKPGNVSLGVPHRLDRPVSGVVLFARNSKAAARLAEQFQKHQVTKVYWAAVEGDPPELDGVWDDWLRKLPDEARSERVAAGEPG